MYSWHVGDTANKLSKYTNTRSRSSWGITLIVHEATKMAFLNDSEFQHAFDIGVDLRLNCRRYRVVTLFDESRISHINDLFQNLCLTEDFSICVFGFVYLVADSRLVLQVCLLFVVQYRNHARGPRFNAILTWAWSRWTVLSFLHVWHTQLEARRIRVRFDCHRRLCWSNPCPFDVPLFKAVELTLFW